MELTNAPSLLAVGTDLLITWTADVSTFASKRFTVLTSPTEDTFTVLLDFQHNNTAASIPPLWHRVTYFYLRLILPSSASQSSQCEFASSANIQHSGWPAPCGSGEYLKVLGTPWFDPQHPIINADNFLDFSYRPLRSNANNTVSCVPCGPGLDCSSTTDKPPAAGFHGGIVVDKGFWRVDWALDAATLAARCRNTNACERGGRCASEFKTGPLCEVCKVGYGMRAGVCVDCDRQDFLPVVIIGGLLVVVVTLLIVFRKVLHEFRAVWWSIGRIFKVLIDCAQIVGAMPGVLGNIDWPEELQGLFSILDFFSLDMTQYIGLACLDGKETNYYQKSGMMLIFVSTVLAAAFIAFRVSICRKQQ